MTDVCCWIVRVSDRFGEYGLTGLAVFKISGDLLELNTFLLSCRVLGRGIEYALLAELEKYCKSMAVERIAVHYRNTNKNNVLKRFLDELRQHSSAWATDTQLRVGSLSVAGQNNILVGGVLD